MINFKKITRLAVSAGLILTLLTGCGAQDKSDAKEAADQFLKAVKENDQDSINTYASSAVATGDFAAILDAEDLKNSFLQESGGASLSDEAKAKVDSFTNRLSTMIQSYEIKDVAINEDKSASVVASVTTAFSVSATNSEAFQQKLDDAVNQYYDEKHDEILEVNAQQGEEASAALIYEDLTLLVLDMYEQELNASGPETYAIALTLQKNAETGNWYVSNIQNYDNYINGTVAPATDTDTTDVSPSNTDTVIDAAPAEDTVDSTTGE